MPIFTQKSIGDNIPVLFGKSIVDSDTNTRIDILQIAASYTNK